MVRPFLTAAWTNLVMLNYECPAADLEPLVPRGVELDDRGGRHFVSVVAFRFENTRLLGVPVPGYRNFEEINLRFYVRRWEGSELRRGVVFIREVVSRRAIVAVARWVYNENYVCRPTGSDVCRPAGGAAGRAEYRWRCGANAMAAGADFTGEAERPPPGSEAEFITEHYWGYVRQRDGSTKEYRVDHPPWRVWPAKRAWLTGDAADFYGPAFGRALAAEPASAFVADGSPVAVYRGRRLPN